MTVSFSLTYLLIMLVLYLIKSEVLCRNDFKNLSTIKSHLFKTQDKNIVKKYWRNKREEILETSTVKLTNDLFSLLQKLKIKIGDELFNELDQLEVNKLKNSTLQSTSAKWNFETEVDLEEVSLKQTTTEQVSTINFEYDEETKKTDYDYDAIGWRIGDSSSTTKEQSHIEVKNTLKHTTTDANKLPNKGLAIKKGSATVVTESNFNKKESSIESFENEVIVLRRREGIWLNGHCRCNYYLRSNAYIIKISIKLFYILIFVILYIE